MDSFVRGGNKWFCRQPGLKKKHSTQYKIKNIMLGELNKDQMNNVLFSQVLGRLACTDGKQPYIVPVTYTFDGKYIYGQSNEGTKLEIVRKNPNVCFEVDRMMDMRNWQSVIVYGKFEELKAKEAEKAREILFNNVFPLLTSSTIHPFGHQVTGKVDDSTRVKQVMYRIKIQKMTGRFEKQ
jgi:nitroimidazol reductase NimA-like FMN-containing flavoprotein (pyridoxamine 5'-phosphate oxidase superfamily)